MQSYHLPQGVVVTAATSVVREPYYTVDSSVLPCHMDPTPHTVEGMVGTIYLPTVWVWIQVA